MPRVGRGQERALAFESDISDTLERGKRPHGCSKELEPSDRRELMENDATSEKEQVILSVVAPSSVQKRP